MTSADFVAAVTAPRAESPLTRCSGTLLPRAMRRMNRASLCLCSIFSAEQTLSTLPASAAQVYAADMEMTEIDIAWIRRRAQELERDDLTPAAARMIAIQEVCKRRESRDRREKIANAIPAPAR
ncbi:MAG: hypothetical protein AAFV26_05885 [Pseudomonadota bacterium]